MAGQYFDKEGKEITLIEWAKLFEDRDYQRIRHSDLGGVSVSTVWLGIDHNWGQQGPPVIFETMVFGHYEEEFMVRYCTEDEAIIGHIAVVEQVLAEFPSDAEAATAAKAAQAIATDLERQ